ncbi:MAG: protein kinase [Cyanobacteria bacterium REEB67]|nr:protein kinase [Cyanobacteria bacterium REEB67]
MEKVENEEELASLQESVAAEKQAPQAKLKEKDEEMQPRLVVGDGGGEKQQSSVANSALSVRDETITSAELSQKEEPGDNGVASSEASGQNGAIETSGKTPLHVSVVDILAIIMIGFTWFAYATVTAGAGQTAVAEIAVKIITFITWFIFATFQSYWMRDLILRLDFARNKIGFWSKVDKVASLHPFVILMAVGICTIPMHFIPGARVATAIIVTITLLAFFLRWVWLNLTLPLVIAHATNPKTTRVNDLAVLVAVGFVLTSVVTMALVTFMSLSSIPLISLLALFTLTGAAAVILRNMIIRANPEKQLKYGQKERYVPFVPQAGEVVFVYNHFVELQKFIKQRVSLRSPWKIGLLLIILAAAVAGNLHTNILNYIVHLVETMGQLPGGGPTAAAGGPASQLTPNALANTGLVFFFGMAALALAAGSAFAFVRAPKRLAAGKNGIRLVYSRLSRKPDKKIDWSQVKHIKVERPPGKASAASDKLVFERADGESFKIKLAGISSANDREKLLAAIDRYAPEISREAAIEETLRKPLEHNYTELWLQALAAPPKREKLKPLMQGAALSEERYKVERELGVGGQGFAYLATDTRTDEKVVLKEFVLPVFVDINARRQSLENFEKEAKLMTRLDNPQVVKLEGFFVEDHRAYLVLEHIDGENLRQIVERGGPMPEERIVELAAQMCSILKYLHGLSPPLVHRDFTPDNLILRKDGTLKLIDFNVAQQVEVAVTGTVVGKQSYLPPEQFRGQAEPASDLYALGATLYFLAGGKDPTPISVARPLKDGLPVSESLDKLISSLTQMEAQARPANAEQVAERLSKAGEQEKIQTTETNKPHLLNQ